MPHGRLSLSMLQCLNMCINCGKMLILTGHDTVHVASRWHTSPRVFKRFCSSTKSPNSSTAFWFTVLPVFSISLDAAASFFRKVAKGTPRSSFTVSPNAPRSRILPSISSLEVRRRCSSRFSSSTCPFSSRCARASSSYTPCVG